MECGAVWCGGVWCGVVWWSVVWCGRVWCGVVWWCGVEWCGVVECGGMWHGVVWWNVVWCGMVECGVFRLEYTESLSSLTQNQNHQQMTPFKPHVPSSNPPSYLASGQINEQVVKVTISKAYDVANHAHHSGRPGIRLVHLPPLTRRRAVTPQLP